MGAQLKELMTLMLQNQIAIAADRFYKRPHPGRKHLVKYPRKLEPRQRNEQGWDAGAPAQLQAGTLTITCHCSVP